MKIVEFNGFEDDYKKKVKHVQDAMKGPAIVLVWATWCPHCTTMKDDWNRLKQANANVAHIVEIESSNLEKIRNADRALFKRLYSRPDQVSYPMIKFVRSNKGSVYDKERTFDEMQKHATTYFKKSKKKAAPKAAAKTVPKKGTASAKKLSGGNADIKDFQRELNDYIKRVLSNVK